MIHFNLRCFSCGHNNPASARYCAGCGESLELDECGSCMALLAPKARFCGQCGAPAAERKGTGRSIAGEQLRTATILFGFLDGLPAWAEELDPEELKDLLDELFALLSQTVKRQGGTLDKIMPDGIMVLFGVPQAHEDDPIRGVLAAREMVAAVESFNRTLFKKRGLSISFKVGLNTGKVLMGYVGIRDGRDFTVLGDAVNIASRLKVLAPPGGILIAESTRRLIGDRFPLSSWETVQLKGKEKAIPVYEVHPGEVTPHRELRDVPLVGRNAELDTLIGLWREVEDRREVHWVTVLGTLGIGKSRLLKEFCRVITMSTPAPYILHIEGVPSQDGEASDYMRRLIYALAGVQEGDSYFEEWQKLKDLAKEGNPKNRGELDSLAHALASMAHVADSGYGSGAALIKLKRFEPLIARVAKLAKNQPILLAFSTLDEADSLTLDFIQTLAKKLPACPVMVVGIARPVGLQKRRPNWAQGQERHHRITVQPLNRHQTRELLVTLMGDSVHLPPEWVEKMHAFTGGNPYYITQTVQSLKESGHSQRTFTVPDSIESVVQSRLDRLSFEDALTLRAGAVVGHVFWAGAVNAILGSNRQNSLKTLIQRNFIRHQPTSWPPGEEAYTFSHQMMAQVAYDNLLSDVQQRYHLAAAQWLQSFLKDEAGPYQSLLALQLDRGGEALLASNAYLIAAQGSLTTFEYQEGIRLLDRAQACLKDEATPPPLLLAKLASVTGEILRGLGRLEESRLASTKAALLFEELTLNKDVALARLELCRLSLLAGDYDQAEKELAAANANLQPQQGPSTPKASALHLQAEVFLCRGDIEPARPLLRAAEALSRQLDDKAGLASALNSWGRLHDRCSDFESARRSLTEAVHLREALGDSPQLASSLNNLGSVCEVLGDLSAAQHHHARSLSIRRRLGDRWGIATTLINQASVFQKQGYFGRALQRLEEARSTLKAQESQWGVALSDGELGQLLWRVGQFKKAEAAFTSCINITQKIGDRLLEGNVRSHLGRTLIRLGRLAEAREQLDRALVLGSEGGSPEVEALALMALVELSLVEGNNDDALDYIAEVEWNEALAKNPWLTVRLATLGGRVFMAMNQIDEAKKRLEEGTRSAEKYGFLPLAFQAGLFSAQAHRLCNDPEELWSNPLLLTVEELAARVENPKLLRSLLADPLLPAELRRVFIPGVHLEVPG